MANQVDQVKEFIDTLSVPNIAVIGLTGVGKSTLINAVFGMDIAMAGAGRPVTTEYIKYSPEALGVNLPVSLYDSPGYEAGSGDAVFVKQTIDFLNEKSRKGKEEQIHLVWYVVSASAARLKQFDINILEEINRNHIPAIIVLSQCDRATLQEKSKVRSAIEKSNFSKVYETIEVASSPLILPNGQKICEPFGIKELLNRTEELLPEVYSDALIIAQIVDIESKKELAWKYVRNATVACLTGGVAPFPLTAPASIIASLGYMYNRIMIVYGHTNFGLLLGISGITLGGAMTIFIDGAFDLFSLVIPGISLLTGAASATFTAVSGMAFIRTCERLALGQVHGSEDQVKAQLREIFREEFENLSSLRIRISSQNEIPKLKDRFLRDEI